MLSVIQSTCIDFLNTVNKIDVKDFRLTLFLFPTSLSSDNTTVHLLIRDTHGKLEHASTTLILSHLREKFWITSLRKTIKSYHR